MTNKSFSIDHDKKIISITKSFLNNAAKVNSEEAKNLLYWKDVFPNYSTRLRAVSPNKQSHKRLTIDFMERYTHMRNCEIAMRELETLKELYAFEVKTKEEISHLDKAERKAIRDKEKADRLNHYTKIKAWFIDKYPDYSDSKAFAKYISQTADKAQVGIVENNDNSMPIASGL